MDFINQVKQLKDQTKSPEVRQICENYLNGRGEASPEVLSDLIKESFETPEGSPNTQNYREAIKREEAETSKRMAEAMMESWGGLGRNTSLNNAGAYIKSQKTNANEEALLEKISEFSGSDLTAGSFVKAHSLKNLGVLEAISTIRNSSIYEHSPVRIVCEKYASVIESKDVPEFNLIHSFIAEASAFVWDNTINDVVSELTEKAQKYAREIEVSKVLESVKGSGSSSFYSELSDSLSSWLISESKSSGILAKSISKWSFNPVVRNLINYLNVNESKKSDSLSIPVNTQGESSVHRIHSPVLVESGKTIFSIGTSLFEATPNGLTKVSQKQISEIPSDYLNLVSAFNSPGVSVNENGVFVRFGKKTVRLVEENSQLSVYLDRSKLNFRSLGELGKLLGLEAGAYFGVNENETISKVITLYRGYNDIVELDFAKSIVSNIYEGVSANLIKWEGKIYINRVNQGMNENSLFPVNGTQAVQMVKEFLRYDISEGLTEFLEGEQKIKSLMLNDRNKVLENISKVESEISKIENLMESNPLYANSKEIKAAKNLLNNELNSLKEKWNQINVEISNFEEMPSAQVDLSEDEKFNIGAYVKVKESGETGKIISIDGTSGRYTVILDNGKTTDYLVNEIQDLDSALSQAAEDNEESRDEDGEEGVKESNNLNKSNLSIEEQKQILKTLATNHGFSKAPKGENEEIEMELDGLHGYNITMNEAAKKSKASASSNAPFSEAPGDSKMNKGKDVKKGDLAVAPGNDNKNKGKVEGVDLLDDNAPETKDKTDFDGHDEAGKEYEIGYNLREGKDGDMVEAPETGKNASETKATSSAITGKQNLAVAPGKGKEVDFEADADHGYNLQESELLKKK